MKETKNQPLVMMKLTEESRSFIEKSVTPATTTKQLMTWQHLYHKNNPGICTSPHSIFFLTLYVWFFSFQVSTLT